MRLRHFSKTKLAFDPYFEYPQSPDQMLYKPTGLWLSDENRDDGWQSWCQVNEFGIYRLKHWSDFELDLDKILHLKNSNEIINFSDKYSHTKYSMIAVDWEIVKKDYSGILITPYNYACRLHHRCLWYYGWDCASACIWDLSSIYFIDQGENVEHQACQ